jgi:hypothetical protein
MEAGNEGATDEKNVCANHGRLGPAPGRWVALLAAQRSICDLRDQDKIEFGCVCFFGAEPSCKPSRTRHRHHDRVDRGNYQHFDMLPLPTRPAAIARLCAEIRRVHGSQRLDRDDIRIWLVGSLLQVEAVPGRAQSVARLQVLMTPSRRNVCQQPAAICVMP